MNVYLGIDVGSTTVKLVAVGENPSTGRQEILYKKYERHFSQVREKAAAYMGRGVDDVTFIKTKLDTETDPASYQIVFFDQAGAQYECLLDAKNGDLLDSVQSYTDMVVDTRKFLPLNEVRRLALETAGLSDAVFTKEKLDSEDEIYYYKIEFYDAVGKSYDVELVAETGALLKYTFKEQARIDDSRFISLADAKKNALVRAGDFHEEQVTFTKEKLDGAVYLLSFTLEDGTQYTIELDAETGLANTVDVVRASADTTQFIGFSAAKELAMKKAGLPLTETVTYTKAKIDRENAAYVYELEFENGDYQYEVRLNTKTGEILKFRAWFQ